MVNFIDAFKADCGIKLLKNLVTLKALNTVALRGG